MAGVVVALLCFIILFGGIVLLAIRIADWMFTALVVDRHKALAEIVETGDVPSSWRRAQGWSWTGAPHYGYVRRLDRLRRYVEQSPAVDNETTRKMVLTRLDDVRAVWLEDSSPADEPLPNGAVRSTRETRSGTARLS